MNQFVSGLRPYTFVVFALLLLISVPLKAQCTREVLTKAATPVYDVPPTFFTASGWKVGNLVETLPANTKVTICEEKTVGLFADKKKWYRISFANGRVGWIYSEQVLAANGSMPTRGISFALITEATAAEGDATPAGVPASAGIPGFSPLMMLIAALLFVLVGIVAKVVFDAVDDSPSQPLFACIEIRKFVKALVAAPLAFLAFLNFANFSASSEVAVAVYFCMAFQNGFFWQTLVPSGRAVGKGAAESASAH